MAKRDHDIGFLLIAWFKLFKGGLLFAVGVGALSLLHKDVEVVVNHWARVLQLHAQSRWIQKSVIFLGVADRRELSLIIGTTFFYSALLLTEGVGLLFEKVWAEYLTSVITVSFIPFEVYEMFRQVTAARIVILVVNTAIVAYLAFRLQQRAVAKRQRKV